MGVADEPHLWSLALTFSPFLVLLVSVTCATLDALPKPLVHGQHADVDSLARVIDVAVRGYGPFLPLFLFAVQWWFLSYDKLSERSVIRKEHGIGWLPKCHARAALILWILIVIARIGLFLVIRGYHYYFSDHIFLICSLVGMIQMKLYVAHHDALKHGTSYGFGCVATMVVGWFLILILAREAFVTSKYYHTVEADWLAFICGTAIFGGASYWWICHLNPENDGDYEQLKGDRV